MTRSQTKKELRLFLLLLLFSESSAKMKFSVLRPLFGQCHFSDTSRKSSCMQTYEDTGRTYLGTQLDILLQTRVIDGNVFSAMPKAGLRIFQTNTSPKWHDNWSSEYNTDVPPFSERRYVDELNNSLWKRKGYWPFRLLKQRSTCRQFVQAAQPERKGLAMLLERTNTLNEGFRQLPLHHKRNRDAELPVVNVTM